MARREKKISTVKRAGSAIARTAKKLSSKLPVVMAMRRAPVMVNWSLMTRLPPP